MRGYSKQIRPFFFVVLVAAVGAWITIVSFAGETPLVQLGPEQRISNDGDFAHWESMVVVDPTNPNRLVASAVTHNVPGKINDQAVWTTSTYASDDGGQTWTATRMATYETGDPMLAVGPDGTVYYAVLNKTTSHRVNVYSSTDGGKTWSTPILLPDSVDHEMMAVDRSTGPYRGRLYIAARSWTGSDVISYYSDDKGKTFQRKIASRDVPGGFVDKLQVLGDGSVIIPVRAKNEIKVVNGQYAGSTQPVYTVRSTDGGQTYGPLKPVYTKQHSTTGVGSGDPSFAVGSLNGKERLYVTWADTSSGRGSIYLQYSEDKGDTWSAKKAVSNGISTNGVYTPHIAANQDGTIGIAWFQIATGSKYNVYFIASSDGGQTFSVGTKLNTVQSQTPQYDPRYPGGDYTFMDTGPDGSFRVVWPDSRSTMMQLYTRRVTVTPAGEAPTDLIKPTVQLTTPLNNATVSGTVSMSADAQDNVGVSQVEFLVDGKLVATKTGAPYVFEWDSKTVADGTHTVQATAYDAAGNTATSSVSVNVQQPKIIDPADINKDSFINAIDLSMLLTNYGKTGVGIAGDVNGDNQVNIIDLSTLLSRWKT